MRNITFAIHSLSRRVGFMIIAVLQISVSLILLYSSIQINEGLNRSNNTVVNYFDKREIYTLSNNEEYQKDLFNDVKPISYEKFNNYLKTSTDFVHISYQGDRLMVKDFRNSDDFVMTTQYFLEDQGNKYVAANALIIEANYIKYFPLKVSEGRSFSETDFTHNNEEQTVPVLLGGNYKYLFSIGDIWEHKNEQTGVISKLKIIGFLESNQFFTDAKLPLNNIKNLENYIVFPKNEIRLNISNDDKVQKQQNINYKLNLYNHIMHSMVLITQEERHKQIIQEITETSREMGFYDIRGINAMNQLEKHKKLYQEQTTIINALFVIIIVISSIGIVSNMLYSIMKRYNEFGIHILTGASIFDIVSRIIYEVLVLIIISLILTYAGITLVSGSGFIHFEIATFIQLCGMAIVLGLLIAVIPTIYILKVQANRLLRRIQ
ncbi:FtsX-like permease family protein [Paenibacillus sp. L3-i20]|uniref:FtsX-like permease family protein n=1 Tax=Paenibacillus sp. L3-i20 TaxID=2905833 RepID=UPI001EDFAF86|nr:FtsX-like permease family protein [Paenibacillus sp. L3-i20]GKU77289.1 hypothetical protein L3i20_v216860 [Paenibacillus sp. L3-i20]